MTKKIFAMFLAVLMVVSMLPISAMAAQHPGEKEHTINNCEYTVVEVKAPTCGNPGYTYYQCKDCPTKFIGSPVPATGEHTMEAAEAVKPTCEKVGYSAGLKCKDCDYREDCTEVPALYKDRRCEWTAWTKLDCTVGGEVSRTCKNPACQAVETKKVEKAESHDFGDIKLKTPATATANGLATKTCQTEGCNVVENITVFFKHDHVKVIVPAVPATCTADGVAEHKECRVCGKKYNVDGDELEDIKGLVLKAGHAWKDDDAPTCIAPTKYCTRCEKNITVSVDHKITTWRTTWFGKDASGQPAQTCTLGGVKVGTCSVAGCPYTTSQNISALGHHEVTKTVAATCSDYGYTFTYCTRPGCDQARMYASAAAAMGVNFSVTILDGIDTFAAPVAPAWTAKEYYLGVTQTKKGTDLFFTGAIAEGELLTSNDSAKAIKVYVEIVHPNKAGAYRLYIKNAAGGKDYIEIYKNADGKAALRITSEVPAGYYTVEGTTLVATLKINNVDTKYTFGCHEDKSALGVKKFGASDDKMYVAVLANTGSTGAARVTNCVINTTAGKNADAHKFGADRILVAKTCTTDGLMEKSCKNCPFTKQETIPAGHEWTNSNGDIKVDGVTVEATKAVGCEDGWQYQQCNKCATADKIVYKKITYTGYGHAMGNLKEFTPSHTAPAGYDKYICAYSDNCKKVEYVGALKTWDGANVHYNSVEEAKIAHPGLDTSAVAVLVKNATCTEYGLVSYDCKTADCTYTVLVKTPTLHDPANSNLNVGYKAPKCEEPGQYQSWKCAACEKQIGTAAIGSAYTNFIPATGHNMVANPEYEAVDCDKPNFDLIVESCLNGCGKTVNAFSDKREIVVDKDGKVVEGAAANLCVATTITTYYCYECDAVHAQNFPGVKNHKMVVDTTVTMVPATCYSEGSYGVKCLYCDTKDTETIDKIEHVNVSGVKFTDKCSDTTVDRHCIVCCNATGYVKHSTSDPHDCKTKDQDGKYQCSCMIPNDHKYTVKKMPSTCLENAYVLSYCTDCGDETVLLANVGWNGHKPVAADAVKYGNFVYDTFTHIAAEVTETVDADGNTVYGFRAVPSTYEAKFVEYVKPSYTTDGYWKGTCQICKEEVTQVLPKHEGAGFIVDIANANGAADYTHGSLIAMTISMNANNVNVFGFQTNVLYDAEKMTLVGSESANGPFTAVVGKPVHNITDNSYDAPSTITIAGYSANTTADNLINEKTEVVTLYFRVIDSEYNVNAAETTLAISTEPTETKIYDRKSFIENKDVNAFAVNGQESAQVKIRQLMNVNNDAKFDLFDLFSALDLIENGKYDVTVDVDKDGILTLSDMIAAYDYFVNQGNAKEAFLDVFFAGLSDEETEEWKVSLGLYKYECSSKTCDYKSVGYIHFCPDCGSNMKAIVNN